jgi:hypothetical protein
VNQITPINPISDDEAAQLVSAEALAELADRIAATGPSRGRRRQRGRARLVVAFAAAAAVAALALSTLGGGAGSARALTFAREGKFLLVIVRDPLADPARYRAEFAAHHLNITLQMIPGSPSIVGTLEFIGGDPGVDPISAPGRCGEKVCPVGAKIPLDFRGRAELAFVRAARPGEQYETSGSAGAPGEPLQGVHYAGHTVAWVLAVLRARHVSVPQYRIQSPGRAESVPPSRVSPSWRVTGAIPWAPGQVLLFVRR